nr:hypothetical protein [Tanacetum cinerariifolium]
MQTIEEKVDTSKALDASLVDKKSNATDLREKDTSSRSGNDAHDDDADIRPIYDEEPMAEKSINEREQYKREYDSWVNEIQMQTTEEKVDTSKALDASLVDRKSNATDLKEKDTSSRSGNDAHDDDADIRPIYDEEPMAEVQTTTEINVFAIRQQHCEQPEFNNKREVD